MRVIVPFLFLMLFIGCSNTNNNTKPVNKVEEKMNAIAERYVKLVLKVGVYDENYVDAYYGPDEWKNVTKDIKKDDRNTLQILNQESDSLLNSLEDLQREKFTTEDKDRLRFLYKQILAVKAKVFMLLGGGLDFDQEVKNFYDVELPKTEMKHFEDVLNELDSLLPGEGSITDRYNNFRNQFIVPEDKLNTLFTTAIKECREKTKKYIRLPEDEKFQLEFVKDKPWAGYNWYKGNGFSVIQVNTSLPVYIERVIDLASHEGYPGHHVYNLLLETKLSKEKGWKEFTVYPLYSPQSLIAEGTANYGIEVMFPKDEKINYEKKVLFPLAGLDSSLADKYYKVLDLLGDLSFAGNDIARDYLSNKITKEEAIKRHMKFLLLTREKAEQRLRFIETYRSYIINYNVGKKLVEEYVEKNMNKSNDPDLRWRIFERLLSTPQTPSGLTKK